MPEYLSKSCNFLAEKWKKYDLWLYVNSVVFASVIWFALGERIKDGPHNIASAAGAIPLGDWNKDGIDDILLTYKDGYSTILYGITENMKKDGRIIGYFSKDEYERKLEKMGLEGKLGQD